MIPPPDGLFAYILCPRNGTQTYYGGQSTVTLDVVEVTASVFDKRLVLQYYGRWKTHLGRSSETGGPPADGEVARRRRPQEDQHDQRDEQDDAREQRGHGHGQSRSGEARLVPELLLQTGGGRERVELSVAGGGAVVVVGGRRRRGHGAVVLFGCVGRFLQARFAFLVGRRQTTAVGLVLHLNAVFAFLSHFRRRLVTLRRCTSDGLPKAGWQVSAPLANSAV